MSVFDTTRVCHYRGVRASLSCRMIKRVDVEVLASDILEQPRLVSETCRLVC